ncbi:alpha-glucosidase, partial [Salmonella enterica subsp. enterica]|nr:alpha-glucosidase [Salmonella enterica subsp. enterica]
MSEPAADADWWRGAVIYQIYPRSFQDSDGDGVGDIKGILQRLPYVADLGVDAIWISPFFQSPMKDFGYDVSDYRAIDPLFGSLADFDALIAEAHRLGLKVMIDGVISHTSDQHPWFIESRAARDNAKADWYVWADPQPDGSPPNNWLSVFGGPAWQWDTRRLQYYLHNFLPEQPDLNFHNRDVQDALLDVVRFWMDRGVDGFRLDTINFYFHSQGLEDNPALAPEDRNAQTAPAVNPYNYQDHIYDKSRPENLAFLERFRAVLDAYPAAATVGEVGDSQRGLEIIAAYTAGGRRVNMCYAFDFLGPDKLDAAGVRKVLEDFGRAAPDGWACWALSNHDVVRHATRWGADEADVDAYLKVLSALLLSLRGSVCLYEGEELGLREAEV